MADYRSSYETAQRRPVGMNNAGTQASARTAPETQTLPFRHAAALPPANHHSHARSVSSSLFNAAANNGGPPPPHQWTRRTPSVSTSSSTISSGPARATSHSSAHHLRRSTSSRSGRSVTPMSYVALMRKQKATVWCDRSQYEDPRLVAQAKAARLRANMEVVGSAAARVSTSAAGLVAGVGGGGGGGGGGVRSKIRHAGTGKSPSYNNSMNLAAGVGVPMRLSASEVGDEENSEDEAAAADPGVSGAGPTGAYHHRTSSGRSSLAGSASRPVATSPSPNEMPPAPKEEEEEGGGGRPVDNDTAETPVPGGRATFDYFEHGIENAPGSNGGGGGGGGAGGEEESFDLVGEMKGPRRAAAKKDGRGSKDDLARRGSVDERGRGAAGGIGLRLFVANPDLSD